MSEELSAEQTDLVSLELVRNFLNICQELCGQRSKVTERICQEVISLTKGRARLLLHRTLPQESVSSLLSNSVSFPVLFCNRAYGNLQVALDPDGPSLPVAISQTIAQLCGWILYTLEMAGFMEVQSRHLSQTPLPQIARFIDSLSKREREILMLMLQGYSQEEMSHILEITTATLNKHRQHIYYSLGVHSKQDALLLAYQAGLFWYAKELSSD
ncbi:hypothetical protein EPA93_15015 [Ktedonosporobacter rubrisoli]|uniref:HTH luxR-type domain-containing protein n=1 Tax=Ktedonosporobacter rubrisoli TaxID=2509675 RepID=A0A4P6JPM4_KTERU|nr:LuxR C-terminal-related transcriptional regulator [Ktedonosporobacter rubrisoli]QBD77235.1 hypothetical protein EPA93_15015 [Ktedonosporobacter rubrisoli]